MTDRLRDGSDDSAPPRPGAVPGAQRRQFLRLQAGDLREALAQAVEAQHLRLQFAEPHRHRVQVALHPFLVALRFLALVGENDRLQPRVLDGGRPLAA